MIEFFQKMDPPIINEASFSAANPSSYSLSELWSFPISGAGVGTSDLGGLGLRMGSYSGFCGDATAASVDESTVTEHSGSRGATASARRKRKDVNSEDESSKIVSTSSANDLVSFNEVLKSCCSVRFVWSFLSFLLFSCIFYSFCLILS